MENTENDYLAKYRYVPPSNEELFVKLKRIADRGNVEGVRRFVKDYDLNASPRDLNKIVRIQGYKFIRRNGKLLYIKDTVYYRQVMESDILEDMDNEDNNSEDVSNNSKELVVRKYKTNNTYNDEMENNSEEDNSDEMDNNLEDSLVDRRYKRNNFNDDMDNNIMYNKHSKNIRMEDKIEQLIDTNKMLSKLLKSYIQKQENLTPSKQTNLQEDLQEDSEDGTVEKSINNPPVQTSRKQTINNSPKQHKLASGANPTNNTLSQSLKEQLAQSLRYPILQPLNKPKLQKELNMQPLLTNANSNRMVLMGLK
jgi:hypothetical protein